MDKKKLEIVTGDGSDIDMSPVHTHINSMKPKANSKKKNIIIPKGNKK